MSEDRQPFLIRDLLKFNLKKQINIEEVESFDQIVLQSIHVVQIQNLI